eukprot:1612315-Pyramimonas_sp.AAC.1
MFAYRAAPANQQRRHFCGTERVDTGAERVDSGTERVDSGTEKVDSGTEGADSGTERVDSGTEGVVWSSEDAQRPQHRLQTANQCVRRPTASARTLDRESRCTGAQYVQGRCSRFPEAFTLVRLDARSGTQDLFILGPLATPVYCEADDR